MKYQVYEIESIANHPSATVGNVLVEVDGPVETLAEAREKVQEIKRVSPNKNYTILTIY